MLQKEASFGDIKLIFMAVSLASLIVFQLKLRGLYCIFSALKSLIFSGTTIR
ncbi:hypothetical protein H1P_810005 [Hyella patelloides LEGE 07179]|uniref:Uncharacterized protein n=1 Tax=Hyella patelloides LEGE 07179 TaxID=945734 RepID=A0A563W4T5_9CYAN|nr:hypothetical protein H1P_810005 [Hyella patelloides LEGE 07179]